MSKGLVIIIIWSNYVSWRDGSSIFQTICFMSCPGLAILAMASATNDIAKSGRLNPLQWQLSGPRGHRGRGALPATSHWFSVQFLKLKIHGSLNVPIEHHPTIRYMVYNGYYKVMSNIPKMGHLPTPEISMTFYPFNPFNRIPWDTACPQNEQVLNRGF